MSRAVPVKGLRELDRFLSVLPKNMQTGAYRSALTAAARPIRDEARLRAPKETGKMAKGIRTGSPRKNADGTFSISISATGHWGFLARFAEYGTVAHYINAGGSGFSPNLLTRAALNGGTSDVASQALVINGNFVTGQILHPGQPARPFMRPALDIRADDALRAFAGRIRSYLEGKTGFIAPVDEAA